MTAQRVDDSEDMKKVLVYFKMSNAMNKLTLTKGVTMKDVKEKTGELQGFNYILTSIAKDNKECTKSRGLTPEERALSSQWLQYSILLRGKSPPAPREALKEVDSSLASTAFLAGHYMTLADPVLYLTLYPTILELNFFEKEKYPHLTRWFRLMQNQDELQKGNRKIIFSKTLLYNSINCHP